MNKVYCQEVMQRLSTVGEIHLAVRQSLICFYLFRPDDQRVGGGLKADRKKQEIV